MENFSYFSERFSISKTTGYSLSLQMGASSYMYAILDTAHNEYVAIKYATYSSKDQNLSLFEKIKNVVLNDAFLNKNFKNISFACLTNKSILIPTPLFDKHGLKKMFKINHLLMDDEELHFNYIQNVDLYNVFSLQSKVTTFMVNHFPQIKFFHHSSSFINWSFEDELKSKFKLPSVRININDDFFDIFVIVSDKPILYNTFSFKENTDIVYHTANVMKQLEIKPTKCYVFLSGNLQGKQETLLPQMQALFPSGAIIREKIDALYEYPEVKPHLLYNVLNLHKCE